MGPDLIRTFQRVAPDWVKLLEKQQVDWRAHLQEVGNALDFGRTDLVPCRDLVFRAFAECRPASAKVVIVGQDPYFDGSAVGLAFSVARGGLIPPSLRRIYDEVPGNPRRNGDLSGWCRQGVLLLNRVLTTTRGMARAHRHIGWERFTQAAIVSLLAAYPKKIVLILWGADALTLYTDSLHENALAIIGSSHPSPNRGACYAKLKDRRGLKCPAFVKSAPFARANEALTNARIKPIRWNSTGSGVDAR